MDWLDYVKQNHSMLNLRFMVSKPKHPRHDWRGHYTKRLSLWARYGKARLYIPISLVTNAGYIDLINKSYKVTSDMEGAEAKIKEVYAYLSDHAG